MLCGPRVPMDYLKKKTSFKKKGNNSTADDGKQTDKSKKKEKKKPKQQEQQQQQQENKQQQKQQNEKQQQQQHQQQENKQVQQQQEEKQQQQQQQHENEQTAEKQHQQQRQRKQEPQQQLTQPSEGKQQSKQKEKLAKEQHQESKIPRYQYPESQAKSSQSDAQYKRDRPETKQNIAVLQEHDTKDSHLTDRQPKLTEQDCHALKEVQSKQPLDRRQPDTEPTKEKATPEHKHQEQPVMVEWQSTSEDKQQHSSVVELESQPTLEDDRQQYSAKVEPQPISKDEPHSTSVDEHQQYSADLEHQAKPEQQLDKPLKTISSSKESESKERKVNEEFDTPVTEWSVAAKLEKWEKQIEDEDEDDEGIEMEDQDENEEEGVGMEVSEGKTVESLVEETCITREEGPVCEEEVEELTAGQDTLDDESSKVIDLIETPSEALIGEEEPNIQHQALFGPIIEKEIESKVDTAPHQEQIQFDIQESEEEIRHRAIKRFAILMLVSFTVNVVITWLKNI